MAEPKEGTGFCNVCEEDVPSHDLMGHIRVMHPDLYEEPLTWPDGSYVIIDESLEPQDFADGETDG